MSGQAAILATISGGGAGIISNNASNLIANNAGNLTGSVLGPAAGLISNNAGNLISNNAAGLIANNSAGIIANNAGGYRLPRRTLALSGQTHGIAYASVEVIDERNRVLSHAVVSDAHGNYTIGNVAPSESLIFVRARYLDAAREVTLITAAPAPRQLGAITVSLDPATTLVAKKLLESASLGRVQVAQVPYDTLAQAAAAIAPYMSNLAVAAAVTGDAAAAAQTFDTMVTQSPSLNGAMTGVLANTPGSPLLVATPATGGAVPIVAPVSTGSGANSGPPVVVLPPGLSSSFSTPDAFSIQAIAGSSTAGDAAGTSPTTATFGQLGGLQNDPNGNTYVSDTTNNQIRLVAAAGGPVTVFAGAASGATGFGGDGGAATAASLSAPEGLCYTANGTLLVCDAGNNRIRAISNGVISTIAGGGAAPADQVFNAGFAQLNQPWSVVADTAGNIYFTERGTGKVRKIDATNQLSTLATLTPGAVGPLALDQTDGLLWVSVGNQVQVITGLSTTPTVSATPVFTAVPTSGSPVISGLAYDQADTLFIGQSDFTTTPSVDARIYRAQVDTTGQVHAGRSAEAIAGTGGTSASDAGYAVSTTLGANAASQLLAGRSWNGLYIDLRNANSSTVASGFLYVGDNSPAGWGELLKLTPSSL